MQNNEFINLFDKMVDAFGAIKPQEKSRIYYEKLKHISIEVFEKTIDKILSEYERFPSIAKILETARVFQIEKKRESCPKCVEGFVMKWKHTFRCRCNAGLILANYITLDPVTPEDKKRVYGRLNAEYRNLYGKDLVEGYAYVGEPQKLSPIVDKAVDIFNATVTSISNQKGF